MSDSSIILVPVDPHYMPDEAKTRDAEAYLHRLLPNAEVITVHDGEHIQFFFAGANFESVSCPACQTALNQDWWGEAMDADADDLGFELAPVLMPCCGSRYTLNQLHYDGPQAFGCYAIECINPNVSVLSDSDRAAVEQILGTPLTVVYQRL